MEERYSRFRGHAALNVGQALQDAVRRGAFKEASMLMDVHKWEAQQLLGRTSPEGAHALSPPPGGGKPSAPDMQSSGVPAPPHLQTLHRLLCAAASAKGVSCADREDLPGLMRRFSGQGLVLLNAVNADGVTALHIALRENHIAAAVALLDLGADVSVRAVECRSSADVCMAGDLALHVAMRSVKPCAIALLRRLCGPGLSLLNAKGSGENTPLHVALRSNNAVTASFLYELGADVYLRNALGDLPIHLVAWCIEPGCIMSQDCRVLLLGEANFSFTLALASLLEAGNDKSPAQQFLRLEPENNGHVEIVATCIEDPDERAQKYPESVGILTRINALSSRFVRVQHQVNAWDLQASFGHDTHWDIIAWNHPHLGTEDFRLHRFLLAHFFAAAEASLSPGGRIVLSLVEGQEQRWDLVAQAARRDLSVVAAVPFWASEFPGYECKRNTTGKSFKNLPSQRGVAAAMRSWTYHLGRTTEFSPMPEVAVMPILSQAEKLDASACSPCRDADPTSCRPIVAGLACEACGKQFSCAQGLRTHKRQVHELCKYGDKWRPELSGRETCLECGRSFCDADALRQHMIARHRSADATRDQAAKGLRGARGPSTLGFGKTADASKCTGADSDSPIETSEYGFVACEICGMAVPRDVPMEAHLEALRPLTGLHLRCECGRPFVELRALEQHANFCPVATRSREY